MRIGIDARFYGSIGKGIGRYIQKLIEYLERIDETNDYIIFLQKANWEEFLPKNPRFEKVLADYRWYSLQEQVFMPLKIRSQKVDLMHFPHFNVPLFYRGKFVVTVHDLIITHFPTERATTLGPFFYNLKRLGYKFVINSAVKRAQKIITVSEYSKNDLAKNFKLDPDKIKVTYEAIFEERLALTEREELLRDLGIEKPYLLYVGNAYPHKNLERLVRVFKKLVGHDKLKLKLVLVGKEDYFQKRLKEEVRREKLADKIIFTGFVKDRYLALLYQQATLFIFPSLAEGFGLPPLEAMYHGLPVVSSKASCLPEILGEAAYFFNPEDDEDMRQKINEVLRDQELRKKLTDKGKERVKKYSWSHLAEITHKLYQENASKSER